MQETTFLCAVLDVPLLLQWCALSLGVSGVLASANWALEHPEHTHVTLVMIYIQQHM